MKQKLFDILWGIFAFSFGILFIIGGIQNLFFEPTVDHPGYNELYPLLLGILGVGLGSYIIYAWFKQRSKMGS